MKWLRPERVERAALAIHEWWQSAQNQGGKHLLPLIALLERGAGDCVDIVFEESDDFTFWNRYFLLPGDDSSPYVVPLTLQRGEAGYPHSNAATIRKNRWSKWKMATYRQDDSGATRWRLAESYAEIFRVKALTKGGEVHPVPVVDLAVLLFQRESFEDDSSALALETRFRDRFRQSNADYERLFAFNDEPANALFTGAQPDGAEYDNALLSALTPEARLQEQTDDEFDDEDAVLVQVRELLALGTNGVIFRGAPGTGKSWYARKIAARLVGDPRTDIFRVQFHPSYGYEDFIQGYRPDSSATSGFEIVSKTFLTACKHAEALAESKQLVVLIIDEINRGDPARIFGEALTYIEREYRDQEFTLPYSGASQSVPANLLLLGTLNPYDRSIAQLDAAFVRRFDQIDIPPDSEVVAGFLEASGNFSQSQIERITTWFEALQHMLPSGLGHSYFKDVCRLEDLDLVWRHRIQPACEAAFEFDPKNRTDTYDSFNALRQALAEPDPRPAAVDAPMLST